MGISKNKENEITNGRCRMKDYLIQICLEWKFKLKVKISIQKKKKCVFSEIDITLFNSFFFHFLKYFVRFIYFVSVLVVSLFLLFRSWNIDSYVERERKKVMLSIVSVACTFMLYLGYLSFAWDVISRCFKGVLNPLRRVGQLLLKHGAYNNSFGRHNSCSEVILTLILTWWLI